MSTLTRFSALWLVIAARLLWAQEPAKAPAAPNRQADLAILEAAYKADMDEVSTRYEKGFAALQVWYLAGLDKLQAETMKAGDLEGTLEFKAERERIVARAETTQEQIKAMPAKLSKLRAMYEPALKKITDQADVQKSADRSKHLANLEALQKRLTSDGNLDEALLVKKEKDQFARDMADAAGVSIAKPLAASTSPAAGVADAQAPKSAAPRVTKERPFVNTLGMKFVSVPGTKALFCIWDTRVKDYAVYARVEKAGDAWKNQVSDGVPLSRKPDYPVVGVSWDDANAFCQWLTKKETADGKLPKGMKYRLPTDEEWSRAVGLAQEDGATPKERSGKNQVNFPWGMEYPPSKAKVGNYADASYHETFPKGAWLEGYTDGHAMTSPVESFPANEYGLYDMGGNVWQWCEDQYEPENAERVLRGASWHDYDRSVLLSSSRIRNVTSRRNNSFGFRCVVEVSAR